ncbi:MAG TPA: HEAT repeat domain-containing protein [Anaeromyxobacteraceae bacterium]|nr:HEAT repeat domain-containing protein [Anaeromyxobacteraceae bacterium]
MGADEEKVGKRAVALVRSLRWVLWVLLLVSVLATLEGLPALREAVRAGRVPHVLTLLPVALVGAFIVGYAFYRFTLVRAGRYPAGKTMMQLALMSLFLALLVRWAMDRDIPAAAARPVDLSRALVSTEPDLRALAAEVLRSRPRAEAMAHAERLVALLSDPSPEVRRQAHASLTALVGKDLGEGAAAAARWRAALAQPR